MISKAKITKLIFLLVLLIILLGVIFSCTSKESDNIYKKDGLIYCYNVEPGKSFIFNEKNYLVVNDNTIEDSIKNKKRVCTSHVTDMSGLFMNEKNYLDEIDIDNWDVSNVEKMDSMFKNASYFNQDLSSWRVEKIEEKPINFDLGTFSWKLPGPSWNSDNSLLIKQINFNGVEFNVVFEDIENEEVDILLAFHGTTIDDSKKIPAAKRMLENTKKIIDNNNNNIMIVSVAYPQENLLIGDNLEYAQASLLWAKKKAEEDLGKKINNLYLIGHSLGGYVVTRLNTMHETEGVISNAPGPINLSFRCSLEEKNLDELKEVCSIFKEEYGNAFQNPTKYIERSLINFTTGYKSEILFIQGKDDKPIQLNLWEDFKKKLTECKNCKEIKILEIENSGHRAIFVDKDAKKEVNNFLSK